MTPKKTIDQRLPRIAQRIDVDGSAHVDYGVLIQLAGPLILTSALQSILSLTDTWFLGRLSSTAVAAMGATYFLVLTTFFFVGGVALSVQTLVAQAYGAGDLRRAAAAVWTGLWAALGAAPAFVALAYCGGVLLAPFGLSPAVHSLALQYWTPRLLGGPLAVAVWGLMGFFSGVGRTRITLAITLVIALSNLVLNPILMFGLGWGIAGSAWATTAAQGIGVGVSLFIFLASPMRREFASDRTWKPQVAAIRKLFALGVPMGISAMADLGAAAVFQLMLVSLGTVEGAATQIVMMLTSLAYMPGLGVAMAGTTLVGQAIGVGDRDWALRLGNNIIGVVVAVMGIVSIGLALGGPWLAPVFVASTDPDSLAIGKLATLLLWIGAAYQLFDGLNLGSSLCLRGAGDARVPALLVIGLAWLGWVPLTHMLAFSSGRGLFGLLPHFGYGALGGWSALLIYVFALGATLNWRWRTRAWQRIDLA